MAPFRLPRSTVAETIAIGAVWLGYFFVAIFLVDSVSSSWARISFNHGWLQTASYGECETS